MNYKFKVGDKVVMTNDFGVCWGVKTILDLGERTNMPTYGYEDSDTPWFQVNERNFDLADESDIIKAGDTRLNQTCNWEYFQKKYGFKPTLYQLGGCG
jgi:hypothetical protein